MDIKPVYIYALVDPRNNEVRYVGKAIDVTRRLYAHLCPANQKVDPNKHKVHWLNFLRNAGLKPGILILEECTEETWKEAEIKWIVFYRQVTNGLLNISDGGDSGPGSAPEIMRKIGADHWVERRKAQGKRPLHCLFCGNVTATMIRVCADCKAMFIRENGGSRPDWLMYLEDEAYNGKRKVRTRERHIDRRCKIERVAIAGIMGEPL